MESIFITGSRGDIGSRLKAGFISLGHKVRGSENETLRIENKDYFDAIDNPESIDVLYHLAAISFVPLSWDNPSDFIKINVLGTSNVLDFCNTYNIKLVYISSYAYGIPQYLPIDENHPVLSVNPYALSKNMGEQLCEFYGKNFQLSYNIIRPFNVFGSLKNKSMLIPEIIDQIIEGENVKVKDLVPKRDYIFIDDVIDFLMISKSKFTNDVYNLGSGLSYSVKEIIDTCQKVWGTDIEVVSAQVTRKNEIPETISNMAKVKNVFNWSPKFNLEEGLIVMKDKIENLND
jgi:nucleoside-diphosphate-sugar epimerase